MISDVRQAEVQALGRTMVEAIASIMDWYNITPSASELYAYMFFEDRPMTLEEMKDVMGMSKSNMSYAVRSLIEAKMVYKLDYKLNRRELYRADPDFLSSFQQFLTSKLEREIKVVTSAIEDVLPRLKQIADDRHTEVPVRRHANHYINKVLHAKDYYSWLKGFVDRLRHETL